MSTWEAGIVELAEADDRRVAFEAAVRLESSRLFRLAISILHDAGEAEDAVQESMMRAWKAWDSLHDPERRNAWLTQICVNQCLSQKRRRGGRWLLFADHSAKVSDAQTVAYADTGDLDLDRAYQHLSLHQRAVLTLHYQYGYKLDECARLMRCRPGTVRSHLARALSTLRQEMADV